MAYNGASANPTGEPTDTKSGPPPSLSEDIKKDLLESASTERTGQSAPGKDAETKVKSAEGLEKEGEKQGQTYSQR